jgi:hypothetical protein
MVAIFLLWRIFGLATAISHGDDVLQTNAAAAESASVRLEAAPELLIPVTGGHQIGAGSFVVYGLLVFGAMVLILALFNLLNRRATTRAPQAPQQDDR